jgi:SOS regulatory protein LexA
MSLSTVIAAIIVALVISAIAATAGYYLQTRLKRLEELEKQRLPPISAMPVSLPLVGKITAGRPILADENIEDYLSLDKNYARDATFALQVQGESLIKAGIQDKDIVLIREQRVASNGDIVVAILTDIGGSEATLKRFYQEDSYIRLQPENDAEKPIILVPKRTDVDRVKTEYERKGIDVHIIAEVTMEIVGKVVGVLRTYWDIPSQPSFSLHSERMR